MWFPRPPRPGNNLPSEDSFGSTDELLLLGAGAARDGDHAQARFYLEWALRDDPPIAQFAESWYWLSRIADDPEERRRCLTQVLGAEPLHAEARRDLAILDGRLPGRRDRRPERAARAPHAGWHCGGARRPALSLPQLRQHALFDPTQHGVICQFCGYRGTGTRKDEPSIDGPPPALAQEQDWEAAIYTARGHRWVLPASTC